MASIAYDKSLFLGGQDAPEWGGHNAPVPPGQLTPVLGGQYHRILQARPQHSTILE